MSDAVCMVIFVVQAASPWPLEWDLPEPAPSGVMGEDVRDRLSVRLEPHDDPELQRVADFLAPRLRGLLAGEKKLYVLRLERTASGSGVFSLSQSGVLLTQRELQPDVHGFECSSLWWAMKSAWARARDRHATAFLGVISEPSKIDEPRREPLPEAEEPVFRVSLRSLLQLERMSAYGVGLGYTDVFRVFQVATEFGYLRAPVDDALSIHHLFGEVHLGRRWLSAYALEVSGRLTALVASGGTNDQASLDAGVGAGAYFEIPSRPVTWVRATVLGHPVTQRYLLDDTERTSSPVSLTVSVGVGL